MPPKKKIEKILDNNKYNSGIAQTIEAGGNFINNVKNPWFVLFLIFMIGGGYIAYKATYVISNSLNHVADQIDKLTDILSDTKNQNNQQIEMLHDINKELKDYHSYQEKRK